MTDARPPLVEFVRPFLAIHMLLGDAAGLMARSAGGLHFGLAWVREEVVGLGRWCCALARTMDANRKMPDRLVDKGSPSQF